MYYENEEGVNISARDDKRGTFHFDAYSNDPKEDHDSIHISIREDGTGRITEKFDGKTETTEIDLNKDK